MAEFPQSAASRAALQDAARDYLNHRIASGKASERAKEFGVTERTVNRWRASLAGKGSQKRNPLSKSSTFSKWGKVTVKLTATYRPGDDDSYKRDNKPMTADVPAGFFSQALSDADEAWQTFLDANVYPLGTVENVQSIRFQ